MNINQPRMNQIDDYISKINPYSNDNPAVIVNDDLEIDSTFFCVDSKYYFTNGNDNNLNIVTDMLWIHMEQQEYTDPYSLVVADRTSDSWKSMHDHIATLI